MSASPTTTAIHTSGRSRDTTPKLTDSTLPLSLEHPVRSGKPKGAPEGALWFAESISLSSTGSADLRLPPTAFSSGFDLLALRARRRRKSRRGHVPPQEVRETKRTQFATIQLSTFPQQTLQLVEIGPRPSGVESYKCRTSPARLRSTTASSPSCGHSGLASSSTSARSRSASRRGQHSSSQPSAPSRSSSSSGFLARRFRRDDRQLGDGRNTSPHGSSGRASESPGLLSGGASASGGRPRGRRPAGGVGRGRSTAPGGRPPAGARHSGSSATPRLL